MLSRRLKCSVSFSSHGQWSEYLQWECLTVFQSSKSHNRVFRLSPALLYPGYSDIWLTSLIDCFLLYLEKKILLTDHLYSLVIYHWSYFYILGWVVTVTRCNLMDYISCSRLGEISSTECLILNFVSFY